MSDALPLPPRPHLDHYKKVAKDLQQRAPAGRPNPGRSAAGQSAWSRRSPGCSRRPSPQTSRLKSIVRPRASRSAGGRSRRNTSAGRSACSPTPSSSSRLNTASRAGRGLPATSKKSPRPIHPSRTSRPPWTPSSGATLQRSGDFCRNIPDSRGHAPRANIGLPCFITSLQTASRTSARRRPPTSSRSRRSCSTPART